MFSLTSPNLTRARLRHSSTRAINRVDIIAAAAVALIASASTLANAAENPARLARAQHACAVILGLVPSDLRYDACLKSLDGSLSEWDYARSVSRDRNTCDRDGLRPGTPAFAVCVIKAVRPQ
jgi:hypothetical protein